MSIVTPRTQRVSRDVRFMPGFPLTAFSKNFTYSSDLAFVSLNKAARIGVGLSTSDRVASLYAVDYGPAPSNAAWSIMVPLVFTNTGYWVTRRVLPAGLWQIWANRWALVDSPAIGTVAGNIGCVSVEDEDNARMPTLDGYFTFTTTGMPNWERWRCFVPRFAGAMHVGMSFSGNALTAGPSFHFQCAQGFGYPSAWPLWTANAANMGLTTNPNCHSRDPGTGQVTWDSKELPLEGAYGKSTITLDINKLASTPALSVTAQLWQAPNDDV